MLRAVHSLWTKRGMCAVQGSRLLEHAFALVCLLAPLPTATERRCDGERKKEGEGERRGEIRKERRAPWSVEQAMQRVRTAFFSSSPLEVTVCAVLPARCRVCLRECVAGV